eukprot:TRINITY_DN4321_c0_g1_i1.p1 TRINITY_DN4321_c0_g1~~TRINITY_DN4321_c0_g1_i1.p1  ORF type:complete len:209 (+),score=25.98 TRINITY_DN4321_c0_g1_i1:661-1287(+)
MPPEVREQPQTSHVAVLAQQRSHTFFGISYCERMGCKEGICTRGHTLYKNDLSECMIPVATICRGINSLCVKRDMAIEKWPKYNKLYRGSCLPPDVLTNFFQPGVTYRCPMYLASSVSRTVAERFTLRSQVQKLQKVLWVIHLDPELKCWHVNHVERTNCPGEEEFLFVPYSVFTVIEIVAGNPLEIHLEAAFDNKDHREDLPLCTWH